MVWLRIDLLKYVFGHGVAFVQARALSLEQQLQDERNSQDHLAEALRKVRSPSPILGFVSAVFRGALRTYHIHFTLVCVDQRLDGGATQ